jgi:hypothetical protein
MLATGYTNQEHMIARYNPWRDFDLRGLIS